MQEEKLKSTFTLSKAISIATLSVPALYATGYFYELGRFSKYGLDNQFFPRSIQEYLIQAYYFFIYFTSEIITHLFNLKSLLTILAVVVVVLFGCVVVLKHQKKFKPKIKEHSEKIQNNSIFHYFGLPIIGSLLGVTTAISFFYIFLLPSILAALVYVFGGSIANKEIGKFEGCNLEALSSKSKCIFIKKNDKAVSEGLLIAKSASHIALWDGSKTTVYPLDKELIEIRFGQLKK